MYFLCFNSSNSLSFKLTEAKIFYYVLFLDLITFLFAFQDLQNKDPESSREEYFVIYRIILSTLYIDLVRILYYNDFTSCRTVAFCDLSNLGLGTPS